MKKKQTSVYLNPDLIKWSKENGGLGKNIEKGLLLVKSNVVALSSCEIDTLLNILATVESSERIRRIRRKISAG